MIKDFLGKLLKSAGRALLVAALISSNIPADAISDTTYVDRFNGGVSAAIGKQPVDAATTVNVTLSGYQTIDGVALTSDRMRVLVKNQTTATQNGIYVVYSGAWMRATDFAGPSGTVQGQLVFVNGGTQAGLWQLSTANPIYIDGTTPSSLSFLQFFPASAVSTIQGYVTQAQNYAILAGTALSSTSTTSNTIGTGAFTFTTQANKNYFPGQFIIASDAANANNFILGTVTSYSGTTLVMNETAIGGSGTKSNWNLAVSGPQGTGTVTNVTFTGDGTVLSSTPSAAVTSTGTLLATLNNQTANKVLAGATSGGAAAPTFRALVNGDLPTSGVSATSYTATNLTVNAQGIITAASNGAASLINRQTFTSSTTWSKPSGYGSNAMVRIEVWGAGGGGGQSSGTSGNGGSGGSSSFGSWVTAYGGSGAGGNAGKGGSGGGYSSTAAIQVFNDTMFEGMGCGLLSSATGAPLTLSGGITYSLALPSGGFYTGGGGGCFGSTAGANSVYGGGGGGGGTGLAGGTSSFGGNGGAGGVAGTAPGGGGGGVTTAGGGSGGGGGSFKYLWIPLSSLGSTETVTIGAGGASGGGNAGAGARGQIVVTVFSGN